MLKRVLIAITQSTSGLFKRTPQFFMSCIDCNGLTLLTQRIELQDGNFSKKKSTTTPVVVSSAANFFGLNKNSTSLELTCASKTGSSLSLLLYQKSQMLSIYL